VPAPWTDYTDWQFNVLVVNWGQPTKEIDMNKSRLTADEFTQTYLGGVTPPPDGGNNMDYVKGNTTASDGAGGLRVRSSKVMVDTSNVIGYLPYNSAVEGWLDGSWIQVQYNGQTAYISAGWVNYQVVDPPDPSTPVTTITAVKFSGEIVVDTTDELGNEYQEVWHVTDMPFTQGPAQP